MDARRYGARPRWTCVFSPVAIPNDGGVVSPVFYPRGRCQGDGTRMLFYIFERTASTAPYHPNAACWADKFGRGDAPPLPGGKNFSPGKKYSLTSTLSIGILSAGFDANPNGMAEMDYEKGTRRCDDGCIARGMARRSGCTGCAFYRAYLSWLWYGRHRADSPFGSALGCHWYWWPNGLAWSHSGASCLWAISEATTRCRL